MEIKTKHKLRKMKVQDLAMMQLSLCYNEETNDYEIFIRRPQGDGIIIQNASNCREVCILTCDKDREVLLVGEINNLDIINVDLARKE